MKKEPTCHCDGGDGEFCFICCPDLCEGKTIEEEYTDLMVRYRELDLYLREQLFDCPCGGETCEKCREIRDVVGLKEGEI